ncbi:MAG: RecX family transcriptional regulator [Paludibacteraceae bacterium]|nr:RecX family transcriptional regulator [Paludibacteraceae bacterium]
MERKEYSTDELRAKAEHYCARAERCPLQVRQKLYQWGADGDTQREILAHLEEHDYLNTARFCRAYVHDHYLLNRWTVEKIRAGLYQLRLPNDDISAALQQIAESPQE